MALQSILTSIHGDRKKEILIQGTVKQCALFVASTCVSLVILSAMFVQPACASSSVVKSSLGASDTLHANYSLLNVSELYFSEKLLNPCVLVNASRLTSGALTEDEKSSKKRIVIDWLNRTTLQCKEEAESIIENNVLKGCSPLKLPTIGIIPSTEDISFQNRTYEVLRLFYPSLINHTARVYFILDQLQRHSWDTTCSSPELSTYAEKLASSMRDLVCFLRLGTLTLEEKDDDNDDSFDIFINQILSEELIDQPVCSRRFLRDCQTVRSAIFLLQRMSNYLEETVFFDDSESFTVPSEIIDDKVLVAIYLALSNLGEQIVRYLPSFL